MRVMRRADQHHGITHNMNVNNAINALTEPHIVKERVGDGEQQTCSLGAEPPVKIVKLETPCERGPC